MTSSFRAVRGDRGAIDRKTVCGTTAAPSSSLPASLTLPFDSVKFHLELIGSREGLGMRRAPMALSRVDPEREQALRDLDPLTVTKLWDNPCWLSFRLNFIAFRFNDPVYRWIETRYGLVRPEFVALYAVGLRDGVAAKNIVASSGLPKNTLSRSIQKLLHRRLLRRETDHDDLRSFVLYLTAPGRAIFEETMPLMIQQQTAMLSVLSETEQRQLCELMDKLVIASPTWPTDLEKEGTAS
ncbi:MarR family winged helix-turn-helix transcriptional regulator [Bosea vaviloviae]|nr:MarR family winged helix-turn-helix transcriptional regulator [Bosea vaviloviae]